MNCSYLNPSALFPASLLPPLTAGERLLHQWDGWNDMTVYKRCCIFRERASQLGFSPFALWALWTLRHESVVIMFSVLTMKKNPSSLCWMSHAPILKKAISQCRHVLVCEWVMAGGVGVSGPDKSYCPPALLVQWLTGRGGGWEWRWETIGGVKDKPRLTAVRGG